MRHLILTLALFALPWTVGAQDNAELLLDLDLVDTLTSALDARIIAPNGDSATIGPIIIDAVPGVYPIWSTCPTLKSNTKYRVIWHEFVPLVVNCREEWIGSLVEPARWATIYRDEDSVLVNDTIYIKTIVCDTVGFRPTVIEYREVTPDWVRAMGQHYIDNAKKETDK